MSDDANRPAKGPTDPERETTQAAEPNRADRAVDWFVDLEAPTATDHDRRRFQSWRRADPAHAREYQDMEGLWRDMGALKDAPLIQDELRDIARLKAERAQARARRGKGLRGLGGLRGLAGRLGLRGWAVATTVVTTAAACLAVALFAGPLLDGWPFGRAGGETYHTALGERRVVALADGSVVTLNTRTRIQVAYADDQRRVRLQAGQASFAVVRDAARPFVVVAGTGSVRALGTEFDVYKTDAGQVIVTLLEGSVEVRPVADDPSAGAPASQDAVTASPVQLTPGDRVAIAARGDVSAVARVDVKRAAAWRDGWVDLKDVPLSHAIREINRYSQTKLVLRDPSLADLRIGGVFRAGRTDGFVTLVQDRFGLRATRLSKHRIVLKEALAE